MDSEDFRVEVRGTLRRIEDGQTSTDGRIRADHDILIRLTASFAEFMSKAEGFEDRMADHEKRLRFLERIGFGVLAVMIVINKFWK